MPLNRRDFIVKGGILGIGGLSSLSVLTLGACKQEEGNIGPAEDLMREHGILNRVLLVYEHFMSEISAGNNINNSMLFEAANVIKVFVEDYHEKQEEEFVFPRFERANVLADLVETLRTQHERGRDITCQVLQLTKNQNSSESDLKKIYGPLADFIKMYRPHEAREDTVLFPALHQIVSKHEFDSMGEDFEKRESQIFGQDGFEKYVDKIAKIEKQLGIYDLSLFTPVSIKCND